MIAFINKETYLTYRSIWKANYKTLSQQIRTLKTSIIKMQRAKGYAGSLQYDLFRKRIEATAMLEERKASKIEAQRQYLAAHKTELVTA